jgi:hypothetical protein
VLSVLRTFRCFFRSPDVAIPFRSRTVVFPSRDGACPARRQPRHHENRPATRCSESSRRFWKSMEKGQAKASPAEKTQYSALSGARRHAIRRHHAIRHRQNYVARERCGLAPNSSARAASRIATPGSSTAETNSSGLAPRSSALPARTIDRCSNSIGMYHHSSRHSSRNPPKPGDPTDSYRRVEWSCRFVLPRSCCQSGSPRCQNPAARVHGRWRCLALPRFARHSRYSLHARCQPSTAAGLATVGSVARSLLYCLLYGLFPYCSASSSDHLLAPPSGQATSCLYSRSGPAYGRPPLREQSEPQPTGFAPTPAA